MGLKKYLSKKSLEKLGVSEDRSHELRPSIEPEADVMKLTETEIWKFKFYQAEARRLQLEAQAAHSRKFAYLKQVDPEGRLAAFDREVADHCNAASQALAGHYDTVAEVQKRYKIDLAHYAWDDETGVLRPVSSLDEAIPNNTGEAPIALNEESSP